MPLKVKCRKRMGVVHRPEAAISLNFNENPMKKVRFPSEVRILRKNRHSLFGALKAEF
jgi:hypothetical protein